MDILYHALTGIAISKSMGGSDPALAAVAAILPDIVGATPFYYYKFRQALASPPTAFPRLLFTPLTSNKFSNAIDAASYRITHSLFAALGVAILAYFVYPNSWIIISLSYLSHILIDIPTHEGDFATRICYPWDMHTRLGKNWSTNWQVSLAFWLYLGSVYLVIG